MKYPVMKMFERKGVGIAGSFLMSAMACGKCAGLLVSRFTICEELQIYVLTAGCMHTRCLLFTGCVASRHPSVTGCVDYR